MTGESGYRKNIGIIILNSKNNVFWAKRVNEDAWQFPQGGVKKNESLANAMYRELAEETGLKRSNIKILARTKKWLYYDVPKKLINHQWKNGYKGQKQIWFLLKLIGDESTIDLNNKLEKSEFDDWIWLEYTMPVKQVISFKRNVYQKALSELATYIFSKEELKSVRLKLSR